MPEKALTAKDATASRQVRRVGPGILAVRAADGAD
jgi:hypothetical protein